MADGQFVYSFDVLGESEGAITVQGALGRKVSVPLVGLHVYQHNEHGLMVWMPNVVYRMLGKWFLPGIPCDARELPARLGEGWGPYIIGGREVAPLAHDLGFILKRDRERGRGCQAQAVKLEPGKRAGTAT